jgi:hypothetical protein
MIIDPGLRVARLDFTKPPHADPDIGGELLLRNAMAFSPLFNSATGDRLDLGQYRRLLFEDAALR